MVSRVNPSDTGGQWGPSDLKADITRREFQMYEQQFEPQVDRALDTALDDEYVGEQADAAGEDVSEVFDATSGQTERRVSRFAGSMTEDQRESNSRNRDIQEALSVASAENSARANAEQTQTDLLRSGMDIGTSMLSTGSSAAGDAASMQAQREQQGKKIEAQKDAQETQMYTTLAAAAISAI